MKYRELKAALEALPDTALDADVAVRVFQDGTTADWFGSSVMLEPVMFEADDGIVVFDLYDTEDPEKRPVNL